MGLTISKGFYFTMQLVMPAPVCPFHKTATAIFLDNCALVCSIPPGFLLFSGEAPQALSWHKKLALLAFTASRRSREGAEVVKQ